MPCLPAALLATLAAQTLGFPNRTLRPITGGGLTTVVTIFADLAFEPFDACAQLRKDLTSCCQLLVSYRQVFAQDRVFLVLALIGDAQALVFLLERFERFDQLGLFHACTLAGAAAISNLFGAFFPRRLSSYRPRSVRGCHSER